MRTVLLILVLLAVCVALPLLASAREPRSASVKRDFQLAHPCPVTGADERAVPRLRQGSHRAACLWWPRCSQQPGRQSITRLAAAPTEMISKGSGRCANAPEDEIKAGEGEALAIACGAEQAKDVAAGIGQSRDPRR